jgi:hypothetical protein
MSGGTSFSFEFTFAERPKILSFSVTPMTSVGTGSPRFDDSSQISDRLWLFEKGLYDDSILIVSCCLRTMNDVDPEFLEPPRRAVHCDAEDLLVFLNALRLASLSLGTRPLSRIDS